MLIRVLLLFVLEVTASLACAQTASELFQAHSPEVVYIQQAVRILPEYFDDLEMVKELERKLERRLINTYLTISSGSGFFVDDSGHLITNNHVIDTKDEKKDRETVGQNWGRYIDENFSTTELNPDNKRLLKVSLYRAITRGPFQLQVLVGNKDFFQAKVLASNAKQDLALLEIPLHGNSFLAVAPNDSVKVGADVYSLGYPFGSDVVKDIRNISSSLTKGSVSAFREEKWIQHTATINPGNSGGPLLNAQGVVVGVNAALRSNANNTYYAIPVATVRKFLTEHQFLSLLPDVDVPVVAPLVDEKGVLRRNSLGDYEVSADLIFNQEKGAHVLIDDVEAGITPLFVSPDKNSFNVRIEGAFGRAEGHFRILKSLQGSTEVIIPWQAYKAQLSVTTTPPGATVLIDSQVVGTSPLTTEVLAGRHIVGAKADRQRFEETTITLSKDEKKSLELSGERLVPLGFQGRGVRPKLVANQGERTFTFGSGDDLALPKGRWIVRWQATPAYEEGEATVDLDDLPSMIDGRAFVAHGTLSVPTLDPQATLYIDTVSQGKGAAGPFAVEVGQHNVAVLQRGFLPFRREVVVTKAETVELELQRELSSSYVGDALFWSGLVATVGGLSWGGFNLYQYTDSVALAQTTSYQGYTEWKTRSHDQYNLGLTIGGFGAAAVLIGLYFAHVYAQDELPPK